MYFEIPHFFVLQIKIYYLIQHPVQLVLGLNYTVTVIAVNHKDQPLSILEIVSPQRSNLDVTKRGVKKEEFNTAEEP